MHNHFLLSVRGLAVHWPHLSAATLCRAPLIAVGAFFPAHSAHSLCTVHSKLGPAPCLVLSQIWYGVPAKAAGALDATMRDALPHLFEKDKLLLHKLVTMLSPTQLMARGVPVCRAVQIPGSFVVTFPDAYHAGEYTS